MEKNGLMEALSESEHFDVVHGRPRCPTTQGSVERLNQTLETILGKRLHEESEVASVRWVDDIHTVVHQYNTRPHSAIGLSPHLAFFGWDFDDVQKEEQSSSVEAVEAVRRTMRLNVASRLASYKKKRLKVISRKVKEKALPGGQKVLVDEQGTEKNPGARRGHGPFSPKRSKEGTVVSNDADSYVIEYRDGSKDTRLRRNLVPIV